MKLSYCRTVRRAPVGFPVQWITPSFTDQVSGAQLRLTHPAKSRPLESSVKHVGASAPNAAAAAIRREETNARFFMEPANAVAPPRPRKKTGGEKSPPVNSRLRELCDSINNFAQS